MGKGDTNPIPEASADVNTKFKGLRSMLHGNSLAWIFLVVIILLALLLTISVVALFVRSPNESAIANSRVTPIVTARVEKKTFNLTPVQVEGTTQTGVTQNVGNAGTVTALNVSAGGTVRSGQVIGRVDGNPVIVLTMAFKLYRNINTGDSGDDVREVQHALQVLGLYRGRLDGTYTKSTSQAVSLLYTRNNLRPPTAALEDQTETAGSGVGEKAGASAVTIPSTSTTATLTPVLKTQIIAISAPQATVSAAAPIGTVLSDTQPLATLKLGNPSVTMRVNTSESANYPVGQAVEITDPNQGKVVARGTVATVSKFTTDTAEGSNEVKPGYDVSVNIFSSDSLSDGAKVLVAPTGTQGSKTAIAVPATALREIGGKTFVNVVGIKDKDDSQDGKQIEVKVDQIVDGWALLAEKPAPSLKRGQRVIVAVSR